MLKALALALSLGAVGPTQAYISLGEKIPLTTLDAATTSFQVDRSSGGIFGLMMIYIEVVDADDSVTAIDMACTASDDQSTTVWALQTCTVAAGTATCLDLAYTKNPAAIATPKRWMYRLDIEGVQSVECTFTDTGGTVLDTIRVVVALSTKG